MIRVVRLSAGLMGGFVVLMAAALVIGRAIPSTQLTYVTGQQIDWQFELMDVERRLAVNLTRGLFDNVARNRLPVWSPDGQHLAFASDGDETRYASHLYRYTPSTGEMMRLTEADTYYNMTAWSPDSQWVAVTATPAQPVGLQVIHAHTGEIRQLTAASQFAGYPAWSPDGSRIAFAVADIDPQVQITSNFHLYQIAPDGTQLALIASDVPASGPLAWSSDGCCVMTPTRENRQDRIVVFDVDTGAQSVLKPSAHPMQPLAAFSPDGQLFAVTLSLTPMHQVVHVFDLGADLISRDLLDDSVVMSAGNAIYQNSPAWSLDSRMVAFVVNNPMSGSDIHLYDIDSGTSSQLTNDLRTKWWPVWRPAR